MINAHDIDPTVGPDVFSYPVLDMDKTILGQQNAMIELLKRLVDSGDRARESKAPDTIDLSPASGSQTVRTYTTKTGLRVIAVLITGAVGDQIRINVGLRPYNFFNNGYFPFPIEVANGVDLSASDITTPSATAWSCYVFGYPF